MLTTKEPQALPKSKREHGAHTKTLQEVLWLTTLYEPVVFIMIEKSVEFIRFIPLKVKDTIVLIDSNAIEIVSILTDNVFIA